MDTTAHVLQNVFVKIRLSFSSPSKRISSSKRSIKNSIYVAKKHLSPIGFTTSNGAATQSNPAFQNKTYHKHKNNKRNKKRKTLKTKHHKNKHTKAQMKSGVIKGVFYFVQFGHDFIDSVFSRRYVLF